jgi:hypothetical protein
MFLLLKLTRITLLKSVLTVVPTLARNYCQCGNITALSVGTKPTGMLLPPKLSETVVSKMLTLREVEVLILSEVEVR